MNAKQAISIVNNFLTSRLGVRLIKRESYTTFSNLPNHLLYYNELSDHDKIRVSALLPYAKSQLGQDLAAIVNNNDNSYEDFFVEFGATDGVTLSNTYLLEKHLNWNGILAEPAKIWHQSLYNNRSAIIDLNCVSNITGEKLNFTEVDSHDRDTKELSSLTEYIDIKRLNKNDVSTSTYSVNTISLYDLLRKYNAPRKIGFLSIDTEGSEYQILHDFPFDEYSFKFIAIEHNYDDKKQQQIYRLLTSKGYERVEASISCWDDWYVYHG